MKEGRGRGERGHAEGSEKGVGGERDVGDGVRKRGCGVMK